MSLNCPVCGGPVPVRKGSGNPRLYCSDRCKGSATYLRSLGTPVVVAAPPDEPLANWPGTTIPMRVSVIAAYEERRNLTDLAEPHGGGR